MDLITAMEHNFGLEKLGFFLSLTHKWYYEMKKVIKKYPYITICVLLLAMITDSREHSNTGHLLGVHILTFKKTKFRILNHVKFSLKKLTITTSTYDGIQMVQNISSGWTILKAIATDFIQSIRVETFKYKIHARIFRVTSICPSAVLQDLISPPKRTTFYNCFSSQN